MFNQLFLSRVFHQLSFDSMNDFFNPADEKVLQDFGAHRVVSVACLIGNCWNQMRIYIFTLPMKL